MMRLRKMKRFTQLIPVIPLLCLSLMFWAFSLDGMAKLWKQNYRSKCKLPPEPAPPQPEKVPLVAVNGTHTLLLSAYMEHRTFRKKVRVIAVALRAEAVAYRCILSCQGECRSSVGIGWIHSDHFGFEYGTVDILCSHPWGCGVPSHVAVTSIDTDGVEQQPVFLDVLNQQMRSESFPHNYTVCISTMFNFTNALQLVQSLEMYKLLGVTRVVIYKTSCDADIQKILDYYTHTGLVEVIPWYMPSHLNMSASWLPELSPGQMHYYGQLPALSDCVYRYMYQTRYIALHDIDELILPQQVDSWPELLPLLEQKYGADYGYMFENTVFRTTVALPPPTSQHPHRRHDSCCPEWQGVSGVNILAHLYHEAPDNNLFHNYKIIVNPRAVFTPTVHGLLYSKRGCIRVEDNMAKMYHTRGPFQTDMTADDLQYDGRLLDYSTRLIPAVNTVLTQTGLIITHATGSPQVAKGV